MKRDQIKNIYLLVLAMLLPVARGAFAQEDSTVTAVREQIPIEEFASSRAINAPQSAVFIMDLKTGEILAEHNVRKALVPASIMKCVTVGALIDKTGHDYRLLTPVYLTGKESDGRLEGNVVVKGAGDPSLNSRHAPGSTDICAEIADALAGRGIKEVAGRILIDESEFDGPAVPPSWQKGDLSQAYGTGSHALNFEDNASGSRSVANPSAIFLSRLGSALSRKGITVGNGDYPDTGRKLLFNHESAPADEIMRSCMMRSDNQYAEGLLRLLAVAEGEKGSTAKGAEESNRYWKRRGAPMEGVTIVDGSGLSRSNRVTAAFMGSVLASKSNDPWYASFFPLAGQEGTLRKFLKGTPLDSYVALKTGSMKGIQCYAGYKLDDNYAPTHVIVIMLNGMADRAAARAEVTRLLLNTFK